MVPMAEPTPSHRIHRGMLMRVLPTATAAYTRERKRCIFMAVCISMPRVWQLLHTQANIRIRVMV